MSGGIGALFGRGQPQQGPLADAQINNRRPSKAQWDRPGKFEHPRNFMKLEQEIEGLEPPYSSLNAVGAPPGSIIYVSDVPLQDHAHVAGNIRNGPLQDESRRLNRRVMLVLRESSMSFMCLTFCLHETQQLEKNHWHVYQHIENSQQAEGGSAKSLKVILQPSWPDELKVPPRDGVTINIEDIWNVEKEVDVKLLGRAEPSSLKALVEAVKNLMCENLDAAVNLVCKPHPVEQPRRNEGRPVDRRGSQREWNRSRRGSRPVEEARDPPGYRVSYGYSTSPR